MIEAEKNMRSKFPHCHVVNTRNGCYQVHKFFPDTSCISRYTGLGIESKTEDGAWKNAWDLYKSAEDTRLINRFSE